MRPAVYLVGLIVWASIQGSIAEMCNDTSWVYYEPTKSCLKLKSESTSMVHLNNSNNLLKNESVCGKDHGSRLVVIQNEEMMKFVMSDVLTVEKQVLKAWIGLVHRDSGWVTTGEGLPAPYLQFPKNMNQTMELELGYGCVYILHGNFYPGLCGDSNYPLCRMDPKEYLTQSQYTDTGPTSLSTVPTMLNVKQDSCQSFNFNVEMDTHDRDARGALYILDATATYATATNTHVSDVPDTDDNYTYAPIDEMDSMCVNGTRADNSTCEGEDTGIEEDSVDSAKKDSTKNDKSEKRRGKSREDRINIGATPTRHSSIHLLLATLMIYLVVSLL